MPLYEYTCQACGEHFEKLVRSMSSADQVVCPRCASMSVKRALSLFATGGSSGTDSTAPACGPVG
ncbi:MAG: zinc ribbon domain-containing protein [Kouleothrix sp.]|jgi:putative FmdB family regulatory protein